MLSHTTERLHKCEHSKKSYKKIFARNKLDHERIFFLKRALNFLSAELMTFRWKTWKSDPKQNTSDNRDEKKNLIYNGDMRESDNFAQLDTLGNSMLSEKKIERNESWVDDL